MLFLCAHASLVRILVHTIDRNSEICNILAGEWLLRKEPGNEAKWSLGTRLSGAWE